jgi:hypothetical protein
MSEDNFILKKKIKCEFYATNFSEEIRSRFRSRRNAEGRLSWHKAHNRPYRFQVTNRKKKKLRREKSLKPRDIS